MDELGQEITRELLTRLEPLSLRRVECEEQIARFQEEIRRIDAVLEAANANGAIPKAPPARPRRRSSTPRVPSRVWTTDAVANASKRLELIRNYLTTNAAKLSDGFTGQSLTQKVSTPTHRISAEKVREALQTLLDEGFVYVDGRVRGGGNLYKLVNAPAPAVSDARTSLDQELLAAAIS